MTLNYLIYEFLIQHVLAYINRLVHVNRLSESIDNPKHFDYDEPGLESINYLFLNY